MKVTFKGLKIPEVQEGKLPCCEARVDCLGITCNTCIFKKENEEILFEYLAEHDLTKLKIQFGLLAKETQERLKQAHAEGKDMEMHLKTGWQRLTLPNWRDTLTYRVQPTPPIKEVTMSDVDEKFGCKVKIVEKEEL